MLDLGLQSLGRQKPVNLALVQSHINKCREVAAGLNTVAIHSDKYCFFFSPLSQLKKTVFHIFLINFFHALHNVLEI